MKSTALALATGLLLVALFPAPGLPYVAPVALVPLLLALDAESRGRRRFLLGWMVGSLFWAGTCYWIYGVLTVHGNVPAAGAAAMFAGFFLAKGLHLGAFAWLTGAWLGRSWAIPAVAAAWTAIEGTHPHAGFTWLMLGNAATNMAVVARLAPLTGVAGMSFALAMMNVAVALALRRHPKKHLAWMLAVPLLYLLPSLPAPAEGRRLAQLVQTKILQEELLAEPWTSQRAGKLLEELQGLSTTGSPSGRRPELIVWPENPAPFYYYNDPQFRSAVEGIARRENAHLLLGTVAYRDCSQREPLNSAVLVGPDGAEIARYDKMKLVPFGEFVPWPLDLLVEKITREAGDYVAGERVVVAPASQGSIGTFICYESVFGDTVRRFVHSGAGVLVNISNDAWFGRSAARDQHLLIARMRAMENRRWLLRAANTGLTAAIDPAGRVTGTLPRDQTGVLVASFDYLEHTTPYTRWGDWFWWTTIAGAAAAKVWERRSP